MKSALLASIALLALPTFALAQSETPAAEAPATETPATETATPEPTVPVEEGLAAWEKIYAVTSHPRCANCHVGEDNIPVWSGPSYGKRQPHGMYISGGESRIGAEFIPCQTCHMETQSDEPHTAPGAPEWHLAPVEQQWIDRSSAEICAQFKDPARNGDRTLEDMAVHVRDDKLVAWGWEPGGDREPAPGSAEETYRAIETWAAAGAPCPQD
jgi:hypothetical protein